MAGKSLELSVYGISPETGFIPSPCPLSKLNGSYFAEWERVMSCLPELLREKRLRKEIESLPVVNFNESTLHSKQEWERAFVILSFLGNGYLWMNHDTDRDQEGALTEQPILPKKIVLPWCAVSEYLGLNPVACYASVILYNYANKDPGGQLITADDLSAIQTFTGTEDESWFYMVHVVIELTGAPALKALANVYDFMADKNNEGIADSLKEMQESLKKMQAVLDEMRKRCDPKTFFNVIRPFLAGSKGNKAVPNGIVYKGVSPEIRKYNGGSAAQSSIVYAFDIFIGAGHSGDPADFIAAMKDYMPREHRDFLMKLQTMPSVRNYCITSRNSGLITAFNGVVNTLISFRRRHFGLVQTYIIDHLVGTNPSEVKGTGGTYLKEFLKCVISDTEIQKINA